jgi:hypothetical protein
MVRDGMVDGTVRKSQKGQSMAFKSQNGHFGSFLLILKCCMSEIHTDKQLV